MTAPLIVRVESVEDRDAVDRVHRLAFGREDEARLVRELRASEAFLPELSLVAEIDGEVIGHLLLTKLRIRADRASTEGLALAPMAVLPEHQGRGVGSELVRHGLDEARRQRHAFVVVLGHPEYYPRFGFTPAQDRGIEPPFECPREAFMVLELIPDALEGIRGVAAYAEPFGIAPS